MSQSVAAAAPLRRGARPRRVPRMRVAVIGGGAVGLSVAWQLTERGITDVVVLEAGESVASLSSTARRSALWLLEVMGRIQTLSTVVECG